MKIKNILTILFILSTSFFTGDIQALEKLSKSKKLSVKDIKQRKLELKKKKESKKDNTKKAHEDKKKKKLEEIKKSEAGKNMKDQKYLDGKIKDIQANYESLKKQYDQYLKDLLNIDISSPTIQKDVVIIDTKFNDVYNGLMQMFAIISFLGLDNKFQKIYDEQYKPNSWMYNLANEVLIITSCLKDLILGALPGQYRYFGYFEIKPDDLESFDYDTYGSDLTALQDLNVLLKTKDKSKIEAADKDSISYYLSSLSDIVANTKQWKTYFDDVLSGKKKAYFFGTPKFIITLFKGWSNELQQILDTTVEINKSLQDSQIKDILKNVGINV